MSEKEESEFNHDTKAKELASESFFKAAVFHEICMNQKKPLFLDNIYQIKADANLLKNLQLESCDKNSNYESTIKLLLDIKEKIIGLLMKKKSLEEEIEKSLNVKDLIDRKIENYEDFMESYLNKTINVLSELCAPVRDSTLGEIIKIEDHCEKISRIYELINLMYTDITKFALEQLNNFDYDQIIDYEKKKFIDVIENLKKSSIDGLEKTKRLFQNSVNFMKENEIKPIKDNILYASFVSLMFWDNDSEFPETFVCDFVRLRKLTVSFHLILFETTISVFFFNFLKNGDFSKLIQKEGNEEKLKQEIHLRVHQELNDDIEKKERMPIGIFFNECTRLADTITRLIVEIVMEINEKDVDHISISKEDLFDEYSQHIWKILARNHPVYTLMKKRALKYIIEVLQSNSPANVKLPLGFYSSKKLGVPKSMTSGLRHEDHRLLESKIDEIEKMSTQLYPIFKYNKDVFTEFYENICKEVNWQNAYC